MGADNAATAFIRTKIGACRTAIFGKGVLAALTARITALEYLAAMAAGHAVVQAPFRTAFRAGGLDNFAQNRRKGRHALLYLSHKRFGFHALTLFQLQRPELSIPAKLAR